MSPDTLSELEERIRSAVEVVTQLRRERDAAIRAALELEPMQQRVVELSRELEAIKAERETMKAERENVRRRVEKLLEQIDSLGAG